MGRTAAPIPLPMLAILLPCLMGADVQHGPFRLKTDGPRIVLWFNGTAIITGDGTTGMSIPAEGSDWQIERTSRFLKATLSRPGVTKRVILRQKDCFVEFGLTADREIRENDYVRYFIEIPRAVFAGSKTAFSGYRGVFAGWVDLTKGWKCDELQTLAVVDRDRRWEFQKAQTLFSLWRTQFEAPADAGGTCQWRTQFQMDKGVTHWAMFRFTPDPKTPLPRDGENSPFAEVGHLQREQGSVPAVGFAVSLRRSAQAVFKGGRMRIDGLYLDHDNRDKPVDYRYRVIDYRGRQVASGTGEIAPGGKGETLHTLADLPCDRTGGFRFDLEAGDGKSKITGQTVFAVLPKPRWFGQEHDGAFGGHVSLGNTDPAMSGLTWTRTHDSQGIREVRWAELEPEPGRYEFKDPEDLKELKAHHLKVLACFATSAPKWLKEQMAERRKKGEKLDRAWYGYDEYLDLYKKFLRKMLKDRGHLIDAIEPQNEPWTSPAEELVNLWRATREVIDEVVPRILLVGPTVPPGSYASDMDARCKEAGAAKYVDVVAGHFYVAQGMAALGCETVLEDWCLNLRRLYTDHGRSKAVWNTEWCTDYPIPFLDHPQHLANIYFPSNEALRIDPHMYAVINVRQFIVQAVHGVKSFWHLYYNTAEMTRRLMEYDYTPNPAGVAFSAATDILDGATFVDRWSPCPDLCGYVVDTPRGAVAAVFGRRFLDGETASVTFPKPIAGGVAVETMGNPIAALNAGTKIVIDNDPVYFLVAGMKGGDLKARLDQAVVEPPMRHGVVANFLFDENPKGNLEQVADVANLYKFSLAGGPSGGRPALIRDVIERGPAATSFNYAGNRCLHFPKDGQTVPTMDETDRFAHVFDATSDPNMAITVEAWVKPGPGSKGRMGVIFEKNRWRQTPQYRLWIDEASRVQWTHVAGMTVFDGKTMTGKLYVNGELVKQNQAQRRPEGAAFTRSMIGGMSRDPQPCGILSDVSVDEIGIYRRALAPRELGWFAGSRTPRLAKAAEAGLTAAQAENWSGFLPVDLSGAANRDLHDTKEGDRKGGWLDQGGNDLGNLMPGDWMMKGVPFRVIDPAANGGKAVIVLKGTFTPWAPERVTVATPNQRVEKLHFLHACGWGAEQAGAPVVTYVLTHQDDRRTTIACRNRIEIADWWYFNSVEKAQVAWTGKNAITSAFRLFLYTWQNPEPTNAVRSIEMIGGQYASPAVLAVTILSMP